MKRTIIILLTAIATYNATCCNDVSPRCTHIATGCKDFVTRCNELLQRVAHADAPRCSGFATTLQAENISAGFADSLQAVATRLGFDPDWLLQVMQAESGLAANATNSIGATGLIQFLPATAIALGTTTEKLRQMDATKQLQYVEKFYLPVANKIGSAEELRLYTFFPAALNQPESFVLETETLPADVVASRNAVFDTNGDMKITKGEFIKAIRK